MPKISKGSSSAKSIDGVTVHFFLHISDNNSFIKISSTVLNLQSGHDFHTKTFKCGIIMQKE